MMATEVCRGTVLQGVGSFYTVEDEDGRIHTLRCKKKNRHRGISPLPGDQVTFLPGEGDSHGWLEEILERKTVCLRPPVANVEVLVIVLAPAPAPDLVLCDRLISRAYAQGMQVILAVNKTDLDAELPERIRQEYRDAGVTVVSVCGRSGDGTEALKAAMGSSLCCFTGQSGAGKSTLLNALLGLELETGDLSEKIERGKNTTRHAALIRKNGLSVMDTAGFNLLETERNVPPEALKERYPEFIPYEGKCRFRECLHDREPGCSVTEAVLEGRLHPGRVERYRQLLEELRESWKERYNGNGGMRS